MHWFSGVEKEARSVAGLLSELSRTVYEMWHIIRPDSHGVWNIPEAERRLRRYRAIIDGRLAAKYLISRLIESDLGCSTTTEELWSHHAVLAKRFASRIEQVDAKVGFLPATGPTETTFLDIKIELARRVLQNCHFCERKCGVDRTHGEKGWCKLGAESRVSSAFLHTGEEAPLVPSGTIFFSSCCFSCAFCQNADISTNPNSGDLVDPRQLASIAEALYHEGALNINYVGGDPIPNTHSILSSMRFQSSNVTQLWNSNLYCSEDTMRLLGEVIDVWLPDFKYGNDECALRLSGAKGYFGIVSRNHMKAYQSGEVIIRHLVLPNHIECCTYPILDWVSKNMPNCMVNLMDQYRPEHRVRAHPKDFPEISRRVTTEEIRKVRARADELGLCWAPVS